ncbi:MAG: TIGR04283 family arsenosugar biosynthesis glycosyltransferase [Paracoccaceae bacterium]|nr:TIGR04283 family arsenosugar biosynthesis glycosyltransferase [Paracoccaceae bacterium]
MTKTVPTISIIIPVLNEAPLIATLLSDLQARFHGAELIVVDGGSHDQTLSDAGPLADIMIRSASGRARQMNAGARLANGQVLIFLHADTRLPDDALTAISAGLAEENRIWGRFDVALSGRHFLLPLIARLMNLRSRLTGVATGDQAIFVTKLAFLAINGFPEIALMEDVALSKRLLRIGAPLCLHTTVMTSGRRWQANGVLRTIVTMWALRLGYVLGVPPAQLAQVWARLRRR